MIISVLLGGVIGFERRASERPAGIRTMSMVCLGSCFFSMCGQLAFKSSTMGWDAARVAAAVPSGVGFLGAGLIWKGSTTASQNVDGKVVKNTSQEVHGLTTAASVWLSAAVGVAIGGGRRLYIVSLYGVALVILVLRFGPKMYFAADSDSMHDFDDEVGSELDSSFSDISHTDEDDGEDHNLEYSEDAMHSDERIRSRGIDVNAQANAGNNNQAESWLKMRSSSSISRHSSAPDLKTMTYEVPIVDHSQNNSKATKPARRPNRKGRIANNKLRLSFHG